jgi:uncharacterized LabA/DUF88 family protein
MENRKETVYAFVDSQNLHLGVKHSGWELDYRVFRNYLRTKYNVVKAFLFIGYVPQNTGLYRYLQESGFILIFKPVMEIRRGINSTFKGNVDAELVLQAMVEINNYDKSIIVSGDGDFYCLAKHLKEKKKLLKIIAPNDKYSSLLREFADYIVSLELLKDKLRKK